MTKAYDRSRAAAESRLESLDDRALDEASAPASDEPDAAAGAVVDPDGYGFHLDDPDGELPEEIADGPVRFDGAAIALDALAETFNARDLDGLLQVLAPDGEAPGLLGYDRDNLPVAVEELWQRRPTCCLTRGRHLDDHVGVLWEHDGQTWWRLAVVHVDDVTEGTIGVVELTDDAALLDEVVADPPSGEDLEEGARWTEWDEGADGEDGDGRR